MDGHLNIKYEENMSLKNLQGTMAGMTPISLAKHSIWLLTLWSRNFTFKF